MCGIAGYWGLQPPDHDAVRETLAAMKQRGPDSQECWYGNAGEGRSVVLLHARLSIIDLDPPC
jgi:asparagine synthase (glutamine-hydrolysing)